MSRHPDPELLEQLLHTHGAALELFAAQWSSAPEDCVQEAFLEFVRQRVPPDNVVAWLYRVVRNRAISGRRALERRRRREAAVAAQGETRLQAPVGAALEALEVTEALGHLEDSLREVVVARVWGGLSYEQIAAVVGISTSAAHRRYEAGLIKLRERLGITCPAKNRHLVT